MDESMGYSSYTFGDPTTHIPRSYLGDPAKWRLVHGGSEVFHSHHLHGGAIRWRRQAKLTQDLNLFGTTNLALASDGPVMFPPVRTMSDRVDVQTIAPRKPTILRLSAARADASIRPEIFCTTAISPTTTWLGCGPFGARTTRCRLERRGPTPCPRSRSCRTERGE